MKQKDIALIMVVVFVSVVISIVASKLLFASPDNRQQSVEVVQPITDSFSPPSTAYFNSQSVDLTKIISIGNSTNQDPFSGKH